MRQLDGRDDVLGALPTENGLGGSLCAYARAQVSHPLDGFGFVVPAIERRRIIAGSFSSVKYDGRAPVEQVLLRG